MDPVWIVRLDAPGDGPRLAVKDCIDIEGLPASLQLIGPPGGKERLIALGRVIEAGLR